MSVQEFVCLETGYGKRCGNAGAQRNHQKTLKKPSIQSPSLLRFLKKRGPPKKMAVELRSITRKPRQIKLSMRPRSSASTAPLFDAPSASVQITYSKPPTRFNWEILVRYESLSCAEDLTLRSEQEAPRISYCWCAVVHYYNSLKGKFSMLDKSIGVKLRAF